MGSQTVNKVPHERGWQTTAVDFIAFNVDGMSWGTLAKAGFGGLVRDNSRTFS